MNSVQIVGIVLAAVGGVLLIFGFNASESVTEEASEMLTGQFTEQTRWYFILGAAGIVGGALLAIFGRRRG